MIWILYSSLASLYQVDTHFDDKHREYVHSSSFTSWNDHDEKKLEVFLTSGSDLACRDLVALCTQTNTKSPDLRQEFLHAKTSGL